MYRRFLKRILDLTVALIALVAFSPIFIVILILLFIANDGKVFFVQERPGKNERIFKILKFKSMNDKKGPDGSLLPDGERITRVGNLVRSTSLDELPQLINVLKGDLSLIGPRPLLIQYLPLYSQRQRRRHEIRPGITGWAQVNGRNSISWPKKFELDVWYVDNCSFLLDLRIIWLTVLKVIQRDGISSETSATMEFFEGN
ncbi:MAG: sugar transferase [Bacteroidota bacterium]